MTINVPALLDLFPRRPKPLQPADAAVATPRGRFDALFRLHSNVFQLSPEHIAAVEAVRTDDRWGPIYRGDLAAYDNDHSRADLALCGEFARRGLNSMAIDHAIRSSGLYRQKWDRDDYRQHTVAAALANAETKPDVRPNTALATQNGRIVVDMAEPPKRDYTLDGLLLPGKSAVLAGFGGVSKTQLALQLCCALVLGGSFMGKVVKSGNVIAILGEEDRTEIKRRLNAVARHHNLDAAQIVRLEQGMLAFPLVGVDMRLTAINEKRLLNDTPFVASVISAAKAAGNVRLIVIDHLALVHGGDFNAREAAAVTMRVVNHIAQETSATVLILAHTPKSANEKEDSDATMIAGSTAFVDQARGAWVLATMRESEAKKLGISAEDRKQYVSLTVVKNNYGPTGEVYWFKRIEFDGVGILEHVTLNTQVASAKGAADLETRIVAFVTMHPGQFSKTRLRDTQSGKTGGHLRASKNEVEGAIEGLISARRLTNRAPTDNERNIFGHGPRVGHVLDVGRP